MSPTMSIESSGFVRLQILAALLAATVGCGLKGDLYIPVEEPPAVEQSVDQSGSETPAENGTEAPPEPPAEMEVETEFRTGTGTGTGTEVETETIEPENTAPGAAENPAPKTD